jgi:hypothetical protein
MGSGSPLAVRSGSPFMDHSSCARFEIDQPDDPYHLTLNVGNADFRVTNYCFANLKRHVQPKSAGTTDTGRSIMIFRRLAVSASIATSGDTPCPTRKDAVGKFVKILHKYATRDRFMAELRVVDRLSVRSSKIIAAGKAAEKPPRVAFQVMISGMSPPGTRRGIRPMGTRSRASPGHGRSDHRSQHRRRAASGCRSSTASARWLRSGGRSRADPLESSHRWTDQVGHSTVVGQAARKPL